MARDLSIDQFNLVVSDMAATIAFYRRLGLEIVDTDPSWEPHHRTARMTNGVDLEFDSREFASHWNNGWSKGMGVLGIKVSSREEVDAIHLDMVAAGYRSQQAPYDAFWGARYAVLEDPDGNAVGLMSPIDPAQRAEPSFAVGEDKARRSAGRSGP